MASDRAGLRLQAGKINPLLAATRTGLTPASDDELTKTKISYSRSLTSVLLGARKKAQWRNQLREIVTSVCGMLEPG